MNPREKYIAVIANDDLREVDALIVLEGDLFERIPEAARLYKEGIAPLVVISGGDRTRLGYARPASEMMPELVKAGVPKTAIRLEENSQNTRQQAKEVSKMAKELQWKSFAIVASQYHQYRAYLTFLKVLQEEGLDRKIVLVNAPARQPKWFTKNAKGRRIDILEEEFHKIDDYKKKGHIASYEDAIAYQEWKESQH